MKFHNITFKAVFALLFSCLGSVPARSHEAWFLDPAEMTYISSLSAPDFFSSPSLFAFIVIPASIVVASFILLEPRWAGFENRIFCKLKNHIADVGPLVLRIGLALMLIIAAIGLLPMEGMQVGEVTLLISNATIPPGKYLTPVLFATQIGIDAMLVVGIQTRIAAVGIMLLVATGHGIFGWQFLDFSPHFIAPALILLSFGSGKYSIISDRRSCLLSSVQNLITPQKAYNWARIMLGLGFAYLAFMYKFLEPQLILAILKASILPDLGQLAGPFALIIGIVEIAAGLLIAFGILVRPVAVLLIIAFTFFSIILGESPFYHSQLYGISFMFLIGGATLTDQSSSLTFQNRRQSTPSASSGKFSLPYYLSAISSKRQSALSVFIMCTTFLIIAVPDIHSNESRVSTNVVRIVGRERIPKIHLEPQQNTEGNWFVRINVDNFLLSGQENTGQKLIPQGHVHIKVDKRNVGSAKKELIFLGALSPGQHTISASLRSMDHRLIVTDNGVINTKLNFTVPALGNSKVSSVSKPQLRGAL